MKDPKTKIFKKLDTILEDIPDHKKHKPKLIETVNMCKKYVEDLSNKKLPEDFPFMFTYRSIGFIKRPKIFLNVPTCEIRDNCIAISGFPIITEKWINPLAEYIGDKKCLEIMAGCGSLTYFLKEKGVNIIATDNKQKTYRGIENGWNEWLEIEKIDCVDAIDKYGHDIGYILLSWPDFKSDSAYKSLMAMRKVNPTCKMICICSWQGCTANNDFFEAAKPPIEDEEFYSTYANFVSWEYCDDEIYLLK